MTNERPFDRPAGANATAERPRPEQAEAIGPGHTVVGQSDTGPTPSVGSMAAPPSSFGGFEILGEIARGGMGVVYKARQTSLNRLVALKLIQGEGLTSDTAIRRFLQEARAAAALDHPNIVPIYECGHEQNQPYYAMAFIDGKSLTALVRERGVMSPDDAVRLLMPVIEAVESAHKHGIIHRDLKPDNVLIDASGRPRITDFGLAKVSGGETDMTRTGNILGTPKYMSPEQAEGRPDIGPPCDVYALGGILFFMLTGQPPFDGTTLTQVVLNVMTTQPPSPRELNPSVPKELADVCLKCLSKEPEERYPSAAALGTQLQSMLMPSIGSFSASNVVHAAPTRPSTASGSSRKWPAVVAAIGVVAAVVALIIMNLRPKDSNSQVNNDQTKDASKKDDRKDKEPDTGPDARKLLPPLKHEDFTLKVEWVDATTEDGLVRVPKGTKCSFRIEVSEDAYVGIWTVDTKGDIVQLYPNESEANNFFKANQARTVPESKQSISAGVLSDGVEVIRVMASAKPWTPSDVAEKVGIFRQFASGTSDDAAAKMKRGLILDPVGETTDHVAEFELPYRVVPKR